MKRSRIRRFRLPLISALVVGVLIAAAGYGYWVYVDHRFWTVTDSQVYRSGAMPVETLQNKIKRYGIQTVIDFRKTHDEVDTEHRALTQMGVKHFSVPTGQVPTGKTVKAFLEIMDDRKNRPVLIHCQHGTGRVVLFSAIYRIEYEGWSNEDARRASRLMLYKSGFSLDSRKGKFLRHYVPRSRLAN
jgi:protein tyrosine/serine phosphatase